MSRSGGDRGELLHPMEGGKQKVSRHGSRVNNVDGGGGMGNGYGHQESDSSSGDSYYTRRGRRSKSKSAAPTVIADYRLAPKLEKFKEGGNIKQFFKMFEEYCRNNVRGSRKFWLGALEDQLEGKVLETFHDLRDEDDEFEDTKEKLIQWYEDTEEVRRKSHKKKFKNAQRRDGDSLYIFSIRLESLFKKAYPTHDVQKSSKLFDRFKKCISRKAREALESQILNAKMKGEDIRWKFVQKWAQLRDNLAGVSSESESEDANSPKRGRTPKEISINLSQGDGYRQDKWQPSRGRSPSVGQRSNGAGMHCYACGKLGHFARECEWGQEKRCYNCADSRHLAKECTKPRVSRDSSQQRRDRSNSSQRGPVAGRGNYSSRGRGDMRGRGGARGAQQQWNRGSMHTGGQGRGYQQFGGSEYYGIPNQYGNGSYGYPGGYVYNPGSMLNPSANSYVPQQQLGGNQQLQSPGENNAPNASRLSGANAQPLN